MECSWQCCRLFIKIRPGILGLTNDALLFLLFTSKHCFNLVVDSLLEKFFIRSDILLRSCESCEVHTLVRFLSIYISICDQWSIMIYFYLATWRDKSPFTV